MTMITDAKDFFSKGCGRCARFATADCSTRQWTEGLDLLRSLCLDAGLAETVKWAHPCYMQGDRNIALITAFRGDFRLSFFNAALMKDPEGVLVKQGPNTRHAGVIRFTDNAQVAALKPVIVSYLEEAMGYAAAGVLPPRETVELDLPEELVDAMDADPELAEGFHALTPGRQRSYVINLNSAKTAATRMSRIGRFRERILNGKGANER